MAYPVSHRVNFEADGRLVSEQRVQVPRGPALEAGFIEPLADEYFRAMQRMTLGVFRTRPRGTGLAMRAPLFGDVLVFDHKHVIEAAHHARVSWSVVGGAMASRRASTGGCLIFEATQDQSGGDVTLIIRVEDYTTRLIDLFGQRLGPIVYHLTQGLSHRTLTVRFLRQMAARRMI